MKKILLFLLLTHTLVAHIQLIKKENPDANATLLVIGGIHGNEPGGYDTAAILATHYKILSNNLWIVPNLNKESIIANRRGIHGDMNRKFAYIKPSDKDKEIVEEIKQIILEKNVSLILNLHDGHGFYRKDYQGSIWNPKAWGQTCVIDQCTLQSQELFGNLSEIAEKVKDHVNQKLLQKHHSFNVKNTKTKEKDEAMRHSLTYFAVTHNKPAFAIETSKNLPSVAQKVFYQLVAIEEYMNIVGIKFTRDFHLNEHDITNILHQYGTLNINNNIFLNLAHIKKHLSYIPIKSTHNDFHFSNPLGLVKKKRGKYVVYIGNKKITTLKPQYFQIADHCPTDYKVMVDGQKLLLPKASYFQVSESFRVLPDNGYRVNVIGFSQKGLKNEVNVKVSLNKIQKKYSLDTNHKEYRVEFYNKDKFCTMLVAQFK